MTKDLFLAVLLTACGFTAGLAAGSWRWHTHYQKAAIEHGAAHYDTTTGEWQWNDAVAER